MELIPVSWNGHAITEAAGYKGVIPIDVALTPGVDIIESDVWHDYPYYGGKKLRSHDLSLLFEVPDDAHYNNLAEWFYAGDQNLYTLIAQDEADGGRLWQIEATAQAIPVRVGNKVVIKIYVPNPLWRQAVLQTSTWNVTASGQQTTVTAIGNQPTPPVIRITPGLAKSGGYAKKAWRPYYNVMTTPMPEYWFLLATINTAALVSDTSKSNQINQVGGITAGALSFPVDTAVGGGLNASGGMCMIDNEQIKYSSISGGIMTVPTGGRGWGGTTAATHADNAVIKNSQMMANGYDLRVLIGQTELPRWLDGMNTAATNVWVTLPAHGAKQEVTLSGSIAGSGDVTTLQFKSTPANAAALGNMKAPGIFYSANGEGYAYTAIDVKKYRATGVSRAARNTSMQVHADGAIFRYIELDIQILYNNPNATDPAYSDEKKPMLDLNASTNTNWVESEFHTVSGLRGGWKPFVFKTLGKISSWYTGPAGAAADPATEMGFAFLAYQVANVWRAETASMEWKLYHPVGVTHIPSTTGRKRREKTTWPAKMEMQKSILGVKWQTVWNEASPSVPAAWEALASHSSVSLGGTYYYLRFYADGNIKQDADNAIYHEVQAITLTLDSANVPGGSLQTAADNYYLDMTMTNVSTGESMSLALAMGVGETLVIDCENKTAVRADGTSIADALSWNSKRASWLDFVKGANLIQFDDAGTTAVAVVLEHRARMAG